MGDPVSGEDDEKANNGLGEGFSAFFDLLRIVAAGEDLEAGEDNKTEHDEAGEREKDVDHGIDYAGEGGDVFVESTGFDDSLEIRCIWFIHGYKFLVFNFRDRDFEGFILVCNWW